MATLLYIWELGAGLGHLSPMAPIARRLVEEGHQVHLALRSLEKVRQVFGDLPLKVWQAPLQVGGDPPFPVPATFAQILDNTCFRSAPEFEVRMQAWQNIVAAVKPDLVMLNHAPSPLLALEACQVPRMLMGSGFTVPGPCQWFPDWRPELGLHPQQLQQDERWLLARLNRWRESQRLPQHERLSQFFEAAEHRLLATFPELDPYGPRRERYQGIWRGLSGEPIDWPARVAGERTTTKIFAYLKPHEQLPALLEHMRRAEAQSLIYVPGLPSATIAQFSGENMVFAQAPVDLFQAARQCDLAILNATHASVATFLLAGKPLLLLPMFLEQRLNAERAVAIGAALSAPAEHMAESGGLLNTLLANQPARHAAEAFRDRYRQFQLDNRPEQVASFVSKAMQ